MGGILGNMIYGVIEGIFMLISQEQCPQYAVVGGIAKWLADALLGCLGL
jgi:hypothetical protein